MKVSSLPILAFLPTSLATTIYLAGDSTMATGGGGSDTAGTFPPTPSHLHPLTNNQAGVTTSPNT